MIGACITALLAFLCIVTVTAMHEALAVTSSQKRLCCAQLLDLAVAETA